MPVLERLRGLRVVADPGALDAARWTPLVAEREVLVLRFAPDDALAIGAADVELDDEHAIIADERGFVGAWCAVEDLVHHAEWSFPATRPAFAQGAIAGVPAKVWLPDGDRALLVATNAASATLADRLGWGRP